MRHVPHLVVPAPWTGDEISLSIIQSRHMSKVLRKGRGDNVTYTDGLGNVGEGRLGEHAVLRGEERFVAREKELTVAVAPPSNKDRQRFLVEKLAELGVARLLWLDTKHGSGRLASNAKVFSWVLTAVEQSQGAWLMETSDDLIPISKVPQPYVVCQPGGSAHTPETATVLIGPEGGFAEEELPLDSKRWSLGPNVLRVETAAMVAAAFLLKD